MNEYPERKIICLVASFLLAALLAPANSHAVSRYVNYQGALNEDDGTPLEGTVSMTLRIYDDPASTLATDMLWEEVQPEVIVRDGVYDVHLGSVTSFDTVAESKTGDYWLEVEVDGEVLGPRQLITSVFFAFQSGEAERAQTAEDADSIDGKDSSDFLDKDTYDADRNARVDDAERADFAPQAGNADSLDNLHAYELQERVTGVCPPGQSIRAIEPSGAVQCEEDDVGITSETDPNVLASVKDGVSWNELSGVPVGFQDGVDDVGVPNPLDLVGARASAGIISGSNTNSTGYGVYGEATAADGSTAGVRGESRSDSGAGVAGLAHATSGFATGVHGQSNAPAGFGVSGSALAPAGPTAGVRGDAYSDTGTGVAGYAHSSEGAADGVYGQTAAIAGKGVRGRHSNNNYGHLGSATDGAYGKHDASGNYGRLGHIQSGAFGFSTGGFGVHGSSDDGTGVRGGSTDGTGVHGISTNGKAGHFEGAGSRVAGSTVYAQNFSETGIAGYFENQSDDATVVLVQNGTGDVLRAFYDTGDSWEYAIRVQRNGWTTISVLELTGGADLSEQFDISGPEGDSTPGMVVVIDPRNPGRLRVSEEAYDPKVAGIISGAGGVRPGMLMAQKGSQADGANPVALTGRVYCWADASYGRIEPGDMLTSSSTPGHAMKVVDHQRAQGAIIGKAMSPLKEGTGLVLVLVSLQ